MGFPSCEDTEGGGFSPSCEDAKGGGRCVSCEDAEGGGGCVSCEDVESSGGADLGDCRCSSEDLFACNLSMKDKNNMLSDQIKGQLLTIRKISFNKHVSWKNK